MAIILEQRGTHSDGTPDMFLKCDDCRMWEHQKTNARIRHSKRCDAKECQPTPAQCGEVETAPAASDAAPSTMTVRGSDGTLREEDAGYMRKLRASGHSWRDINSGNTDF